MLQAQESNLTIELYANGTTFYVGDTVVFQGQLTPPQAASIVLTITITDGSQQTRMLSTNGTGWFEYDWYLASAGPYSASARLFEEGNNQSVVSNIISFTASYPPVSSSTSSTSQESSTAVPSTTTPVSGITSPATTTMTSSTGIPASAAKSSGVLGPFHVAALLIGAIAIMLVVFVTVRRGRTSEAPRKGRSP